MSTKTTIKRIALIAASALGLGLLGLVPANAAAATVSKSTVLKLAGTAADYTSNVNVDEVANVVFSINGTAVSNAACTVTTTENLAAGHAGAGGAAGATASAGTDAVGSATMNAQNSAGGNLSPTTGATNGAWGISSTLSFTPKVSGTYTITLSTTTSACAANSADPATAVTPLVWTIVASTSPSYTVTKGTITPADGSASVGSLVTIPVKLATAHDADTADVVTFTATFAQKPVNTGLINTSIAGGVTSRDASLATAGASTTAVTSSSNTLVATSGATAAQLVTATAAGEYTFTPDVPGLYQISIALSGNNALGDVTAVTAITIIVKGAQVVQGISGKGTSAGTAVAGGTSSVFYQLPGAIAAATTYQIVSSGVGSISNPLRCADGDSTMVYGATATTCSADASNGTASTLNGSTADYSSGIKYVSPGTTTGNVLIGSAHTAAITFSAISNLTGTQTIIISSLNNTTGVPTTLQTVTITWVSAASTAINSTKSSIGIVDTSAHCAAGANVTADQTGLATYAASSLYYKAVAADTTKAYLCLIARDGNGVAITTAPTLNIVTSIGALGSTSGTGHTSATSMTNNTDGSYFIQLSGDALSTGTANITLTAIDANSNAITKTTTFSFFGKLASLSLTQVGYSIAYGSSTPTYAYAKGGTAKDIQVAQIVGKDAGGNVIDFDQTTTAAGYPSISKITVDSSATAGTVTRGNSDSAGATASAATDGYYGAGYGFYGLYANCYASAAAEKLTLSVSGLASDGLTYVDSGTIDVYCSKLSTLSTVLTVTPAATEVAAGGTTTVNVTAKDVNGYPLADGTTITMAASNGAALTSLAPTTKNGVLKLAPTLAAGSNGPITVTAVYGTVASSASVAVTGSTSSAVQDSIDAANEATDAANAATDAANAAAEAADAATAAAQDAQAAVAALASQVADLIAGIKAQIASLTNLVIKIQKKVKA